MAQSRFRSKSTHTLDAKGRLNFPSRFKEVLQQLGSDVLMVAPWKTHLRAYPLAEWEQLETTLHSKGGEHPGMSSFLRYVSGGVVECTLDKQGRILISPELRTRAGLTKEVVLTGMIGWVEIWDKVAMEQETQAALDNFEDFEAGLAKMNII